MKFFNLPKGTRDLSSIEINKRDFLIKIIKNTFQLFGFSPIETPSFEKKSTISGKYGEEGEKLTFKLLHSGQSLIKKGKNFVMDMKKKYYNTNKELDLSTKELNNFFSNKTLRYDLTVPFIRYISMYQNKIFFPFKRYQIQPVWRAENPQKGRWREFYQCDADIASNHSSFWEEIELIQLCDEIFTRLKIPIIIYINHICILKGLIEISGIKNNLWKDFLITLDKWKKIGKNSVKKEMIQKGISRNSFEKISFFLEKKKNFFEEKNFFQEIFQFSKNGKKGIQDLHFIYKMIKNISLKNTKLIWDLSLSRGINYYTGIIWEILPNTDPTNKKNCNDYSYSIGGGGRYQKLPILFGMKNISGVGVSLGLDRIYLFMEENKLFQKKLSFYSPYKILFINFGDEESLYAYEIINFLRKKKISSSLYPYAIKINKQFQYASKNNIPFVISIGKKEMKEKIIKVKNMKSRIEKKYKDIKEFIFQLKDSYPD